MRIKKGLLANCLLIAFLFWGCKKDNDSPQTLATLTTTAATGVSITGATLGGTITNNGNLEILERGICFSDTGAAPTIYNSKVSSGQGDGAFSVTLTDLTANTLYYVRAYATNVKGTSYGNAISFTTLPTGPLPTLATVAPDPSTISSNTAVAGGAISSDGGLPITEKGICWSIGKIPTIKDSKKSDTSKTTNYQVGLVGLRAMTTYTLRSYAINENGVGYGDAITFKTLPGIPRLTTFSVTEVVDASADVMGRIDFNGGGAITSRGFILDVVPGAAKTPENTYTVPLNGTNMDVFDKVFTDLVNYQNYYVRAFAENSTGIGYGNEVFIDVRYPICSMALEAVKARPTYLVLSGSVDNSFNEVITERGFVCSATPKPTLNTPGVKRSQNGGVGLGLFTAQIDKLGAGASFYVRPFARHKFGVGYGNEVVLKTANAYSIGQTLEGGKVFYIDPKNLSRGLIVSDEDLILSATDSSWGCLGKNVSTQDSIGSGAINTGNILVACDSVNILARKCSEYYKNGFGDWYMPSRLEAAELLSKANNVGLTPGTYYWTSSQANATEAYIQGRVNNAVQTKSEPKQNGPTPNKALRAIRKFD